MNETKSRELKMLAKKEVIATESAEKPTTNVQVSAQRKDADRQHGSYPDTQLMPPPSLPQTTQMLANRRTAVLINKGEDNTVFRLDRQNAVGPPRAGPPGAMRREFLDKLNFNATQAREAGIRDDPPWKRLLASRSYIYNSLLAYLINISRPTDIDNYAVI